MTDKRVDCHIPPHSVSIGHRLRQKSWSPSSVSCVAARKIVRRSCLGARPRYNLVVDEDVKKPNKQTNKASNRPHFCGFPQFRAFRTLIREKEMQKKNAYKITLTEPQREMRKDCLQSLTEPHLREPLNCERHAQCTLLFC